MKNQFFTIIFALFPILLLAQFPVAMNLDANSTASKAFYTEASGTSFCVVSNNGKTHLYHFAENGTNLATFPLEIEGNFQANALVSQEGNNLLWLGGTLQANPQSFKQAILMTVEKSTGKLVWQKNVGGERGDELNALALASDENVFFAATTNSMGNGKKDILIGKLDKTGNILWQKNYGWENDEEGKAIIIKKDNSLLIGGNTFSKGAGKSDMLLISADNEGNILWQRVFGKAGNDDLNVLKENEQNQILLAGSSDDKGMKDGKMYFLDKEGKLIWTKSKGELSANSFTDATFKGEEIVSIGNNTKEGKAFIVNWNNKGEMFPKQTQVGAFFYRISADANSICGTNPAAKVAFISPIQHLEKISSLTAQNLIADVEKPKDAPKANAANLSEKLPQIQDNQANTKENQLFLCSIGISSFENPEWENANADVDAKAIFDFFVENGNLAFGNVIPRIFINENAKGQAIKSYLLSVQSEVSDKDVSIFYFNSQAIYLDSTKEIFLLNYDIKSAADVSKGIPLQHISNIFNQIKGEKILIFDIFHKDSPLPQPTDEAIFKEISEQFENTKVIFSAAPKETAKPRTEGRGGVFAKILLESANLKADTNNDKILTFSEWIQAFSKETSNATYETQHPYSPTSESIDAPMLELQ